MSGTDRDPAAEDDTAPMSGARFFPIGFGLGAVAALALFFGYRSVVPDDVAPPANGDAAPGSTVAATGPLPDAVEPAPDTAALVVPEAATEADDYTAAAPDVVAATPDAPDLAGLEALASLNGAGLEREADDVSAPTTFVTGTRLPSIGDPETADLFGGSVMMVSSSVPRVIVLADGTSLVPGGTLPGGHRIVDIRRERILLERDGVEWRVRIP